MVVGEHLATIRPMKNKALALLGLLVLALPACNSTEQERVAVAVDDPVAATLPEIRYYEIADT